MSELNRYKVTIHEHVIYDSYIEATSQEEAEELAENQIIEEDSSLWSEDFDAGWTETGDIELVDGDEDDAELV